MKSKRKLARLSGILLLLLGLVPAALADRPWLEAESTYLGDGWFQYRLGTRPCPFIDAITLGNVGVDFANQVAVGDSPSGWSFTNDVQAMWRAQDQISSWQTEPYDAVFTVRSALTNFQRGTGIVTMSVTLYGMGGTDSVYSANIVGYWMFPALVPCAPDRADGSPPSLYTNLSYSDITIGRLIGDGQAISGIEFNYDYGDATFALEATRDMTNWTRAAYLYGQSGFNLWTTNRDLRSWGSFFRLEYVAADHISLSLLPPLGSLGSPASALAGVVSKRSSPPSVFVEQGQMKVCVRTTPGQKYQVTVYSAGKAAWSAQSVALSDQAVFCIPARSVPPHGVIRTQPIP